MGENKVFPCLKSIAKYPLTLLKWLLLSVVTGTIGGLFGVLFHYAVDIATHFRAENGSIIYLLPISGVVIVFLYHICKLDNDKGTNAVILAVRSSGKVSFLLAPLITVSTALTHLCGGSSGREGAALQIGGSLGSFLARAFRLKEYETSVAIMCGMSALFSAVFGTPLTAAIFSLEVVSVGIMHYGALFPSVMSSLIALNVAGLFGVEKTAFALNFIPKISVVSVSQVLVLSLFAAVLSIVFILSMHKTSKFFSERVENKYLRILIGAFIVIGLTLLVGTNDYNGAGMEVIHLAVEKGVVKPEAFFLKLIFTAVTLSVGFKGGEIVPTFFIGSTFGAFIAPFLGLNPSFAAAIGMIALFCGVVNSPVASLILSVELFGAEGIVYFAVAVATSYVISGYYSLYSGQKIMYSKLHTAFVDKDAK